ncbi:O-antigen ligase [Paenarthrobacter ilicis]|uniref:O-antigen ligase n=1 Tax=Paenarthrobacter ilicis TaxID=43665 RepID=A0ABX0TE62_9MICC|nr:O-antigen ligase [Paenarthrobacter ilicis]
MGAANQARRQGKRNLVLGATQVRDLNMGISRTEERGAALGVTETSAEEARPSGDGRATKVSIRQLVATGPWFQRFILLSVVFMPFQYALTLSVGFPLKISEILAVLGIATYVLGKRSKPRRMDVAGGAALFLAVATVLSAIVNLTPTASGLRTIGYERGFQTDLLLYSGYAFLALTFWAVLRRVERPKIVQATVLSIWLCGAAVLLQWASSLTGNTSIIGLLGFRTLGVDGTVDTLRSGPFLEGQHLGFYAGAAILVALYNRSYSAAAIAALCILYSQSTTAYAGLAAGIALIVVLKFSKVVVPLIAAALTGVLVLLFSDTLRNTLGRQLAKLGFTEFAPDYQFATTSLNQRGVKTEISFDMSLDNPIFGVGPGRYGAFFDQYVNGRQLPWIYSTDQTRPIAENAYAHVAAELGYFALIAFGLLVICLIWRNRRTSPVLVMVAIFVALGVATQSSWTFLPIWTVFGLLAADAPGKEPDAGPPAAAVLG